MPERPLPLLPPLNQMFGPQAATPDDGAVFQDFTALLCVIFPSILFVFHGRRSQLQPYHLTLFKQSLSRLWARFVTCLSPFFHVANEGCVGQHCGSEGAWSIHRLGLHRWRHFCGRTDGSTPSIFGCSSAVGRSRVSVPCPGPSLLSAS